MKKTLFFILIFIFSLTLFAQNKRKAEVDLRVFWGMDNNNWEGVNRLLSERNFDAHFNTITLAKYGIGVLVYKEKFGFEINNEFAYQTYMASLRKYECSFTGLKFLIHYKVYHQKNASLFLFSGMNLQNLSLEIDTLNNASNFSNYFASINNKKMGNIPIGVDIRYKIYEGSGNDRYKPKAMDLGLRFIYNINIYQSSWMHNGNVFSYSLVNATNYFECSLFAGLCF